MSPDSSIVSLLHIDQNIFLAGISFLFIYFFTSLLRLISIGLCQMADNEERETEIKNNLFNFKNLSYTWFDLIKWIFIIGGISFLFERTKDITVMIVLYISYFLLYCRLLDIIMFWIGSIISILDLSQIQEEGKKGKKYICVFGKQYHQTPLLLLIMGLIGVVTLVFLMGTYISINQIVIKLQPAG